MNAPPGHADVLALKAAGESSIEVVISFTGDHAHFDCPHIFPKAGTPYDWSFLVDCPVRVIVRPGIDAADEIHQLLNFCQMDPYPQIVDVGLRRVAYVVWTEPLKLWHFGRNSPDWLEWFQ